MHQNKQINIQFAINLLPKSLDMMQSMKLGVKNHIKRQNQRLKGGSVLLELCNVVKSRKYETTSRFPFFS